MSYLRLLRRFILVGLHVLIAAIIAPLFFRSCEDGNLKPFQKKLIQWEMRFCLQLLGIRVRCSGQIPQKTQLIVSNHISWLDILVIGSTLSSCFLSKSEVRNWPIIGKLTIRYGTVFINRGQDSHLVREEISRRLANHINVALFPEGTTSDGTSVRSFFPRLMATAIDTETPIQPVSLRYLNDNQISNIVPFTSDRPLLNHAIQLMKQKYTEAIIHFGGTITPQGQDRSSLAKQAHTAVLEGISTTCNTNPSSSVFIT